MSLKLRPFFGAGSHRIDVATSKQTIAMTNLSGYHDQVVLVRATVAKMVFEIIFRQRFFGSRFDGAGADEGDLYGLSSSMLPS